MQNFSFLKSTTILLIMFFLFLWCGDPDNPFDNPENVKMTLAIPPKMDSYMWGLGDTVPVNITVSYLSLVDSIQILFGEKDSIASHDTALKITSNLIEDTILTVTHIFAKTGQKSAKAYAYVDGGNNTVDHSITYEIGVKPEIDTLLNSGIAVIGQPYYMCVNASRSSSLIFSWFKNDTVLPQDTGDTLYFETLKMSDSGSYYCTVKNSWGSVTSAAETLSVLPRFGVTYDGNSATEGTPPIDSGYYITGDIVTVLGNTGNMEKTGYTFTGWNTAPDGSGATYHENSTFTMLNTDVVLYAKWTNNPTYTVTYNGNENTSGSVPMDNNNYEKGDNVTVSANTDSLAKTGYTFAGWNTVADGSGTSYVPEDIFVISSANVILYAQWSTTAKALTAFSFTSLAVSGVINETTKTIAVTVPYGTNVTVLIASFTTTGASVKVGATVQVSGTTVNDFTYPVTYTVTAADASTQEYVVTVTVEDPIPITLSAIPGVTVPVEGATPVTTITATAQYTGTVSWNPADNPFAAATVYTATITLKPKTGFTLTGVDQDFFTVTGATLDQNPQNSGVVTAEFPSTDAVVITIAEITGVTAPVKGVTQDQSIDQTAQFTGSVTWSPNDNPYNAATVYTATITLTPKSGFTLTGVDQDFFTVTGATSDQNPQNSGVVTAEFPKTADEVINISAIPGVDAPITGASPVTAITATTQYTGTVSWSGLPATFAPLTTYTATIILTAKSGFTLTGVTQNFFTVAGATSDVNNASSGIVTAVFPTTTNYIVTFDGQSATTPPIPASIELVSPATTVETLPIHPTKTGKCFDGWYTAPGGSGTEFYPNTNVTASITVYAKWADPLVIDGVAYQTLRIGSQTWMVENLRTTKYKNGDPITHIPDVADSDDDWGADTDGAYCHYNNVPDNEYGALYNKYAVENEVAPDGWSVPTANEWSTLHTYLAANGFNHDNTVGGNKIGKSLAATTSWKDTTVTGAVGNDQGSNNRSGFAGTAAGERDYDGHPCQSRGERSYWWVKDTDADVYYLAFEEPGFSVVGLNKHCGEPIRLVRDP